MRRETLGSRWVATLAVLVGLALAGPVAAAPAGTVTFAIPSEPPTVDPAIEVAGPGYRVLFQLYEGLLEYRGTTAELAPALAQSWRVAPDGTSIELKLRPNVKFHDGSTLDAETVKASIDRTKAVNRGGAFFLTTLKEVQVVDPMTVRLVATQPSVSLLYGLPKVFITGKAHLADADRGAAFFATGGNGTGPYRLTRWEKGQQIVLDHFADYWRGWSGDHAAQVIQRVVPAAGTQQLLLERGDAHLVVLASIGITQDPKELAAKPGVKMVDTPAFRVTVISMNTQKGPLKDVRLRKALQAAFDYEGMVQVYKGYAEIPNSPIPKGFTGGVRAEPAAVQARHRPGQAAPRRGGLPGQAADPLLHLYGDGAAGAAGRPPDAAVAPGARDHAQPRGEALRHAGGPDRHPRERAGHPGDVDDDAAVGGPRRASPDALSRQQRRQVLQLLVVRERGRGPPPRRGGPDLRRRQAHGALPRGRAEADRRRALDLGGVPEAHRGDARRRPGLHVQPPQLQRDLLLLPDLAPALGMASLGAVAGPISLRR